MKEIFKGICWALGLGTAFLIMFMTFILFAGKDFIKFLVGIPLNYIWSIGLIFLMFYYIKKRVK